MADTPLYSYPLESSDILSMPGFNTAGELKRFTSNTLKSILSAGEAVTITSANVTLSDAQQRAARLTLSGALTGDRDLLASASQDGLWFITNSTTGSYSVTFKPTAGTGVVIAQGHTGIYLSDGSTVEEISSGFLTTASTDTVYNKTFDDATSYFADNSDATKKLQYQLSGITTATTRTATWPDASGTVVLDTATQTISNKTIANLVLSGSTTEDSHTANTSTALTVDLANGTLQILTLTGNCTFTFPTATVGLGFLMILKQDATGGRSATWPAAVKWASGSTPTITSASNKADVIAFVADGTYWVAWVIGQQFY